MKPARTSKREDGTEGADNSSGQAGRRPASLLPVFAAVIVLSVLLSMFLLPTPFGGYRPLEGIGEGMIAERDVTSERSLVIVDPRATATRLEAELRLVLPVFRFDQTKQDDALERFGKFSSMVSRPADPNFPEWCRRAYSRDS